MSSAPEEKKPYDFGGIKEFSLEQIEKEVLNDTTYLDVFAGSDLRLKDDVVPLTASLAMIKSLNGIKFTYKDQNRFAKGTQVGIVAQDLVGVLPEAVAKDQDNQLYVNYTALVPVLIEAVKELSLKVDALQGELSQLKVRN